ncbi:SRPBCC family protein [Nocardioides coralli]|uniref:SRPBCC family protein n=1 Tax=Nocardioides coralli TaxID=2872154 RepID=UPI001CA3FDF3|nr:SRPBCC domain-containing protein [Nocardioides coralli]QZY29511.1 SRPBCC domain-containing protein [Nocardioides coralli]
MTGNASTESASVVLDRTIGAPIEQVWQMWADPDRFAGWYGPPGAEVRIVEMDVAVGGRRHFSMAMEQPSGPAQMWFVGEFLDVEQPTLLRYTESMSDPDGRVLEPGEAGLPPGHPATTQVTVALADASGATHLRLTHEGVPAGSPGEMGWRMALDKLDAALAG